MSTAGVLFGSYFALIKGTDAGGFGAASVLASQSNSRGIVAVARTGVGVYTHTITSGGGWDTNSMKAVANLRGAGAGGNAQVAFTSGTVLTVTTWLLAVATDLDYVLEVDPLQN